MVERGTWYVVRNYWAPLFYQGDQSGPVSQDSWKDTVHLHVPTDLCPTLSLYKPGSFFSILEIVFGSLILYLPSCSLTEINPFLISQCWSLCLRIYQQWWLNPVCLGLLDLAALAPLRRSYPENT